MNRYLAAILFFGLGFFASCVPHARVYGGASFMAAKGDVGLQNATGNLNLGQDRNSLEAIGADDASASPYLRAEGDWGPHRLRVSGFGLTPSGDGTLAEDFGDLGQGTLVRTELDYVNLSGAYTFDIIPTDMFRVGLGVEVGLHTFDLRVEAQNSSAFESLKADLVLPMPCLDAELDLGDVSICANLGAFEIDLGDADGQYFDAEAFARWEPIFGVEFVGGWRGLSFDTRGNASDRDFEADFDIAGWFIGGGISF